MLERPNSKKFLWITAVFYMYWQGWAHFATDYSFNAWLGTSFFYGMVTGFVWVFVAALFDEI